ncbi:type II secretion system F family protein [Desulforamulus ruminis]|uniref:Type II secretion system F domain protein n=1 Tax=Desulforamulus ruminis (strain ATCC 23193 / DSM 2154 / NCIMB 8452 / DL) TaxID=696281 RepID=F6DRJ9_DESRL|nr:type II secretion system F family protein [Desulforamulus ruminis]AEG58753.1 Type II secretion system F domain protein [Desulforamulus ruminis DSM 2154]
MPQYVYEAMDPAGKAARGTITGNSLSEAGGELRRKGFIITNLREQEAEKVREEKARSFSLNLDDILAKVTRVKQDEVILFLNQLAAMITAGVSIVNALSILEKQSTNKRFKKILSAVRQDVEAGNSLSEAMVQFPKIFPQMITSLLRTGETSGLLDKAMVQVAHYMEERQVLKRQITSSAIYPAIVLLASLGVLYFMVSFVIPNMAPFLEMMGGDLPWNTKLLIYISDNISANLDKVGMVVGGLVAVVLMAYKIPQTRLLIDRYKIKIPLVGSIFQYGLIVSFAKTFSILISSGVSIVEALKCTRDTISNKALVGDLDKIIEKVLYGENISDPLLASRSFFPPMVGNMVKVGEETGFVDTSLLTVSGIYEKMLQLKIQRMTSLIEPILLIVMGGMVGFIAAALIGGIISSYKV